MRVRVDEDEDTVGGSEEGPLLLLSQVVSRGASGRVGRLAYRGPVSSRVARPSASGDQRMGFLAVGVDLS